jgi:2-polyprenyl-6-methoxyphenol hydroxylase-like FAD-dependent oxidoreductase
MALNILIIGAGCAGPACAHIFTKTNPKHRITVVERWPTLRTGGQQLDLKAEGIRIAKAMGILDALKAACVHETGLRLVDNNGASLMQFGVNDAAGQGGNLTHEYEIMRGDMVQVFYDASIKERKAIEERGENEGDLIYRFNTTVTRIDQTSEGATVTFSDGQKEHYDLVVAADGQNSRTRRMIFGDEQEATCFKSIGVHAVYYEIPRVFDDNDARIYFASGSRMVMTRNGDRSKTQVYFFIMKNKERHERFRNVQKQSMEEQKKAWSELYQDAGWECKRFVDGIQTTSDFYATELAQVHMPQLYKGRVVLLGDAGYCPTPFTGMGTTLSLIGSYILAGELAKHGDDVDAALRGYHELMQPPLKSYQRLLATNFYPASALGIKIANHILWTLSTLRVHKLAQRVFRMFPDDKETWQIPVYPELPLGPLKK